MSATDSIKLVVFDLDYTLWDCGTWVDCTTPPFEQDADGRITDQAGNHCRLYPEVVEILARLAEQELPLALASRTHDPEAAKALLELLGIHDRFAYQQIYPGNKLVHFELLLRNIRDTLSIGVRAVHVPAGLNWSLVEPVLPV